LNLLMKKCINLRNNSNDDYAFLCRRQTCWQSSTCQWSVTDGLLWFSSIPVTLWSVVHLFRQECHRAFQTSILS
jgi:hypothetical protein